MNNKTPFPDKREARLEYEKGDAVRGLITEDFAVFVRRTLLTRFPHLTVKARPKSFDSYFKKYIKYLKDDPTASSIAIPDEVGVRVISPFLGDLKAVEEACAEFLTVLEVEKKGASYSFKEFGYESIHLLVEIPEDILKQYGCQFLKTAEIQVRTILQDAWAEVEHELFYKKEFTPYGDSLRRRIAAVNAMLSLADMIFQDVRDMQRKSRQELERRHESFFRQVEENTHVSLVEDALFAGRALFENAALPVQSPANGESSIDDLLLNALYAHNAGRFDKAIEFYGKILELKPPPATCAITYNHRGMAHFAKSHYEDAVKDFSASLALDEGYKALYYRAVVYQVEKDYARAQEDFSRSLTLHPYQPWAHYRRAQVYYHLGDLPAALSDCESALSLKDDFKDAEKFKGFLLEKLKM